MIVAYYRVSTQRQGRSGLGLEAQRVAVEAYARSANDRIVEAFTEVESGRRCDRPELVRALAVARAMKAKLVVAKLDRLSRNVAFLSAVMDAGCDFIACDNPHATRLTLHILAAVAEAEAAMISQRVRDALSAYKARGGVLGSRDPRCRGFLASASAAAAGTASAAPVNREASRQHRAAMRPTIEQMRRQGKTLAEVAAALNARGYRTRRGREWTAATVWMIIKPKSWE